MPQTVTVSDSGRREPQDGDIVAHVREEGAAYLVGRACCGSRIWTHLRTGAAYPPGDINDTVWKILPRGARLVMEV